MDLESDKTLCCPPFDVEKWDSRIFDWNDKLFIKGKVRCFLHVPLNYGSVLCRIFRKIGKKEGISDQRICLSYYPSKWKMELYIEAEETVKRERNIRYSGKILSKVYEGPFSENKKWIDDFNLFAKSKGFSVKKCFFWHTTCSKCAKAYGKNYVVIMGIVE